MKKFIKSNLIDTISLDLRSLAVFRIFIGVIILIDLAVRAVDLETFYTAKGILPAEQIISWTRISSSFSLHLASDTTLFQLIMFGITAIFALMLIFGFKTRIAIIASWILLISLQNRNPIVLQGGDVIFRLLLFWGMFLPLGKVFSIDSLHSVKPKSFKVVSFAAIAFILQYFFLYFFAYLLKTGVEWHWPDFSAVYYALSIEQFSTPIGEMIVKNYEVTRLLTLLTITLEGVAGFLLINPLFNWVTRGICVVLLVGMHIGFSAGLHIGLFSAILIAGILGMIPSQFWNFLDGWLSKRVKKKVRIEYNESNGNQVFRIQFFQKILQLRSVEYVSSKTEVLKVEGENILQNSVIFFPLALFKNIGDFFSKIFSKAQVFHLNEHNELNILAYLVVNFVVLLSLGLVALWNYGDYVDRSYVNDEYRTYVRFARLDQKWNMFSPFPLKDDGWYVVTGYLSDDTKVSLFGNTDLDGDRPQNISATYKNQRWRKFMMNIWSNDFKKYRNDYADYLCRQWNYQESNDVELEDITIDFYLKRTLPNYQEPEIKRTRLVFPKTDGDTTEKWNCFTSRADYD